MAPALPVRPAGCRQTEKMRGYILQTGRKRAIMKKILKNVDERAGGTVAGGMRRSPVPLIRNPN